MPVMPDVFNLEMRTLGFGRTKFLTGKRGLWLRRGLHFESNGEGPTALGLRWIVALDLRLWSAVPGVLACLVQLVHYVDPKNS